MTIPETEQKSHDADVLDIGDILASLSHRAELTAGVAKATLALAASEARLALGSAGMMAILAIVLIILLPITWLVLLATLYLALLALGLDALPSMALLLLTQLSLCALVGAYFYRLSALLAFDRTRKAIRALSSTAISEAENNLS